MRTQTKIFERWVGQEVYREIKPTCGPNAYKILGMRKGIITRIYEESPYYCYSNNLQLHEVEWGGRINWYTGFVEFPQTKELYKGVFEHGISTPLEMDILCKGGLLGKDGPTWDEKQSEELKRILPMYGFALDNPDVLVVPNIWF